ncbi:translation initiation factor IF-2 [Allorhodopirellula heiligendammensis]|uniref:Translation initiation factor IF-2 n=1 Tax=Allorhodopirellula heiligendammensis TaxID=2714739 RepID=A0A5C6C309_9BACT|nr:translation initiation factor IF-2 [Allorhodopirellula heiligendammensis]TWU18465.1 Translation initiation factor IF-2 [Allorhodopirellula heiligendammensis]
MPVRIYALAKELSLDSKDLVDLVKKAGITGKGSALASLTDDEADQVRNSISSASKAAPKAPTAAPVTKESPTQPVAPVRDLDRSAMRRPPSIQIGRPQTRQSSPSDGGANKRPAPVLRAPVLKPAEPTPAPAKPVEPSSPKPEVRLRDVMPSQPGSKPVDAGSKPSEEARQPVEEAKTPPAPPASAPAPRAESKDPAPAADSGMASRIADRMASNSGGRVVPNRPGEPVRREGLGGGGKMRSLDRASARTGSGKPNDAAKARKREPRIKVNLAQLPNAPAPAAPISTTGPAQKPDIKLTRDVIEGHKQGMKAPLARLEKDDAERKRTKKEKETAVVGEFAGRKKIIEEDDKPRGKKGLAGMASARAERARGGGGRRVIGNSDDRSYSRRNRPRIRRKGTNTAAPRKERVQLELPCSVRSFCEASGVAMSDVMKTLMGMGMMININSEMDLETAELIATELNLEIELKAAESLEDELITEIEEQEDNAESLVARAPIVTFLGHVDHGKTSLLDSLIGIDVVKGEAGGITQHIRAYHITKGDRGVTFVDTPGHEAFTEMRARGANVTDIAVIVVAADDGIMPQTEEAISHAKAAEVPIVVALNKVDLAGVDINRVMTQLTEHGLTPSEWGGDVEVVKTSAMTGEGMDDLLETLMTVAELHEYSANPDRSALGVCLESEQHGDKGVVAKVVVQNGTLRVGDIIVCGPAHGRVRAMHDTLTNKPITEAGPSVPVSLTGLDTPPGAGDRFHVLKDITQARQIAGSREDEYSRQSLSGITTKVSFDSFQDLLAGGNLAGEERAKLNLIIRADARGSLEAIDKELSKFDHPEVEIRVLQRAVGGITLADATLASASDAVILGFNVIPDEKARQLADQRNIEIRRYSVIYKLTDDIRMMIEGRLKPEERIVELGRALVKQVFSISRVGTIAGCYVAQGSIVRGCRIRVSRDQRVIGDYPLDTLRRIKEDVKEVPRGMECGIRLSGFNDIKQDDVLEAYRIEQVARKLEASF